MNEHDTITAGSIWPDRKDYHKSVQHRLSLVVGVVLFVSMTITGAVLTNQHTETIKGTFITSLLIQGRTAADLSSRLILGTDVPDGALLTDICQNLKQDNTSIFWVGVSDTNGFYIAHTDIRKVVSGATASNFSSVAAGHSRSHTADMHMIHDDTMFVRIAIEKDGMTAGAVTIAASTDIIRQARMESIRTIGAIIFAIMSVGLTLQVLLTRHSLRAIKTITDAVRHHTESDKTLLIPHKRHDELGYLAASLEVMDQQLTAAQRTRLQHEQMSRELDFARELQASILPEVWPNSPNYSFAGAYCSARQTGGDYYDFIHIGADRLAFLVADVAGKSLPGMLVMLLTREAIRKAGRRVEDPGQLLIYLNDELRGQIKRGTFVTMFYAILDINTATIRFASAGHNPLIRIPSDEKQPQLIKTSGLPLGVYSQQKFNEQLQLDTLQLQTDDLLVQYTDGINEARNGQNEEFGTDRFLQLLAHYRQDTPKNLVTKVLQEHSRFVGDTEQYDDITLLVLRWTSSIQTIEHAPVMQEDVALTVSGVQDYV